MSDADDLDRMLSRAGRALRDEVGGASEGAGRTRARVLATRRGQAQRAAWAMAAAAVLALGLGAPTVWAWSTGRLAGWIDGPRDGATETRDVETTGVDRARAVEPPAAEPTSAGASAEATAVEPTRAGARVEPLALEPLTEQVTIEPSIAARPTAEAIIEPTPEPDAARVVARGASASEPTTEREVVDPAERRAYRAAHALHFGEHDPEGALGAWERYLASYPRGRFAPEARYNSALCLVRLGRRDEARAALAPFAEGAHGSYRQREASQLLDAMSE